MTLYVYPKYSDIVIFITNTYPEQASRFDYLLLFNALADCQTVQGQFGLD